MPRKTDSDNPADWLFVADADLAMIRDSLGNDAAFFPCRAKLAEGLEKVMKAELIRRGWKLIRTHDLQLLATELARCDAALEDEIRPLCQALSEFYLHTRYPGFDLEDPDWPVLRAQFDAITALAAKIRARVSPSAP